MVFTAEQKKILALLCFIQFSHIVDFMLIMPLGPTLMRIFEINPHQFGLLVSVYTFSAGILGLVGSSFIDRFDRKPLLISLYLGFALGTLLCALSPSYTVLLLARSLTGAFGGLLSALILAIVGDVIPFIHRGTAMGILMTSFSLASVVGVPIALLLANFATWHLPFFALAAVSIFALLISSRFFPSLKGHISSDKINQVKFFTPLMRACVESRQRKGLIVSVLFMLGHFAIVPFVSPSLVANAGFKEENLPLVYIVGGLCTIVSGPLIGRAVDKFGLTKMFTLLSILSVIPMLLITNIHPQPLFTTLCIVALFFVGSTARMIPSQTLISSTVHASERGGFTSVIGAAQQLSMAAGSLLAGFMVTKGDDGTLLDFPLVGAFGAIAVLCAIPIGRQIAPFKKD